MVRKSIALLFGVILFSSLVNAQQMKIFNADDAQFLPEIKGMVVFEDGKVVVDYAPEADQREKEYKDVDLQSGDEIQFVNGKRIKSLSDFKKNYGEIKVGDEVKLGFIRDNQRFIVSFKKAEETKSPQKIMKFSTTGESGGKVKVENGKVIIGGKKLDLDSLKKSGANVIIKKGEK